MRRKEVSAKHSRAHPHALSHTGLGASRSGAKWGHSPKTKPPQVVSKSSRVVKCSGASAGSRRIRVTRRRREFGLEESPLYVPCKRMQPLGVEP